MAKIISGVIIEKTESLTLEEFTQAINTEQDFIFKMVEYQLVIPEGNSPEAWRFDSTSLKRGRIALSFYKDLEINMSGIALALELLDKIEKLQKDIEILETGNL